MSHTITGSLAEFSIHDFNRYALASIDKSHPDTRALGIQHPEAFRLKLHLVSGEEARKLDLEIIQRAWEGIKRTYAPSSPIHKRSDRSEVNTAIWGHDVIGIILKIQNMGDHLMMTVSAMGVFPENTLEGIDTKQDAISSCMSLFYASITAAGYHVYGPDISTPSHDFSKPLEIIYGSKSIERE